ncbi:hypothetical protein BGZ94_000386 [Podila epigama]|nr:hypothetical protein BGZ94_000386 [Podila epigama]
MTGQSSLTPLRNAPMMFPLQHPRKRSNTPATPYTTTPTTPPTAVPPHPPKAPNPVIVIHEPLLPKPRPARVKVVIAGGGIGGLALAIMFEAANNIDYVVLERSSIHKTLGSTIALNACALRVIEQLGMLEDIKRIAKPIGGFNIRTDNNEPLGHIDFTFGERQYGYMAYVMSRPALFDILRARIPAAKIHLRKTVSDVVETDQGVTCICADGTEYRGDIVVGADGAYSTVREVMYRNLKAINRLPASDSLPMNLTHVSVLGVSAPMDPKQFPRLLDDHSNFEMTLFRDKPLSVWLSPIQDNRISWSYGGEINSNAGPNSEAWGWGHLDARKILPEIKRLSTEYGPSVGHIIESTPKDSISSVILEDKFFETWNTKRIVLLGDYGVSLANLLANLKSNTSETIEQALKAHALARHKPSRHAVLGSRIFARFIESKSTES